MKNPFRHDILIEEAATESSICGHHVDQSAERPFSARNDGFSVEEDSLD
jgi:hypothetical protein